MVKLCKLLLQNPGRSFQFLYTFTVQMLLIGLRAILLPGLPHYQSLRLRLHRAYWSSSSYCFPELIHRLPVTDCPLARARRVGDKFSGYVIPGTAELSVTPDDKRQRCIVIYAHGGGYARGEARMYLNYMDRWIAGAAQEGLELVFLSVEYPLTHQAPQPAQQQAFLQAYQYVLGCGISPSKIVFMGDSAGDTDSRADKQTVTGGLCLLSCLAAKQNNFPQPAGTVLISPWMDMSLKAFEGGNALVETDYIVGANATVPTFVDAWLDGESGNSPRVNPLSCAPAAFSGLGPVLALAGGGEFALQEGKDLAALLSKAGVRHHLQVEWGQMHLYGLGSAWVDPTVRRNTDGMIYRWMLDCVSDA
ncbi:alpha/beta-hydrolase [Aspergillus japonicus CBS 114.51]|uniref:Alpha/beta-hydrolase n=1 Tax=Aspergillus japonicus CBS 114.51 TaxID=1448312 RepID=A0A8T8WKS8_ASPJA|nr:alpha/beta-hydrolase [Aspergillus japonicus CBS 114.51]RAH76356.1 alpha/beta-hydrolase [Aspergillus japonicus CBS 114.51]